MKPLLPFFFILAFAMPSCKKFVQQQEQKAALNIITNGVWVVNQYIAKDSDITASFAGYVFQFNANGTVAGQKGSGSTQGTWSANINTRQIISAFPTNAPEPLDRLNASWTITDSGDTYVKASTPDPTDSTKTDKLWLTKQ